MDLREFQRLISTSKQEDWTLIPCWGAGAGPSYLEKFDIWTTGKGEFSRFDVDSHSTLLSFRRDLQISVAYGITQNEDFREDWANSFPNSHAASAFVDFFYAKNLVYRDLYVAVDGGRFLVPLPNQTFDKNHTLTGLTVTKERAKFFSILNGYGADHYYNCLKSAGIQLIDGEWML